MITLSKGGAYLLNGNEVIEVGDDSEEILKSKLGQNYLTKEEAAKNTMAYNILNSHNTSGNMEKLQIKFDKLTSHDITFVGIIQTARASGLEKFPIPYVLTNCHNSLCAVGGTINEDDHMFGLTCAKKYGGVYVPPHQAVIHQFAREMLAGGGKMILGSDSHTRYGALGTMAMGEGGPELVKQLLSQTYDINMPGVIGIYMTGAPAKGVGPQDVALAIIGEVFANGYVNNKVMEFVGPGVSNLSADFRIGVDVMTTETTCLSSIWRTDEKIQEFRAKGAEVAYGAFGENLIVEGFDFRALPVGTRFHIGDVVLEMTQIGKECHSHCQIYKRMGDCIMPREGVFAEVVTGGHIKVGDEVVMEQVKSDRPFSAAVITLSDKGAAGEREDKSGPMIVEMLKDAGYDIKETILLPDEQKKLEKELIRLADQRQLNVIFTTGGTGFSERDRTPEATVNVCDRMANGIAEAIRNYSMTITKRAMFSRAVSGIRKKTLIINLPGSPKAVQEALEFLLPELGHGLGILRGTEGECARK